MPWTKPQTWYPHVHTADEWNAQVRDNMLMLATATRAALTLSQLWVNYGAPWPTAAYEKRAGRVFIHGLIRDGTTGVTFATLPAGFRPPLATWVPILLNQGQGRLEISATTGGLVIINQTGTNAWVDITCSFAVV